MINITIHMPFTTIIFFSFTLDRTCNGEDIIFSKDSSIEYYEESGKKFLTAI